MNRSPLLYFGGGKAKDWPNRLPTIPNLRKAFVTNRKSAKESEEKRKCTLQ